MRAIDSVDDNETQVCLRGEMVRKCDVPLGREFIEGGRVFQAVVSPTTYGKLSLDSRYRHGDEWYLKDATGPKPLTPNGPFGRPFFRQRERTPGESERVVGLEVVDRGPA